MPKRLFLIQSATHPKMRNDMTENAHLTAWIRKTRLISNDKIINLKIFTRLKVTIM